MDSKSAYLETHYGRLRREEMDIMKIVEIFVAMISVIVLLLTGIEIGRKYGTFSNFIVAILNKAKHKIT